MQIEKGGQLTQSLSPKVIQGDTAKIPSSTTMLTLNIPYLAVQLVTMQRSASLPDARCSARRRNHPCRSSCNQFLLASIEGEGSVGRSNPITVALTSQAGLRSLDPTRGLHTCISSNPLVGPSSRLRPQVTTTHPPCHLFSRRSVTTITVVPVAICFLLSLLISDPVNETLCSASWCGQGRRCTRTWESFRKDRAAET